MSPFGDGDLHSKFVVEVCDVRGDALVRVSRYKDDLSNNVLSKHDEAFGVDMVDYMDDVHCTGSLVIERGLR